MTLESVKRLIDALNAAGVAHCHWKSNYRLDQALSGQQDLDLLVDHQALLQTFVVLGQLGFQPAEVTRGADSPSGVFHYYGLDERTGRLVHVHLYSRIVTGESFVKSHRFPFEAMLLENTDQSRGIPVPSRAAELVLFVIRTYIKYGSPLDLLYLVKSRRDIEDELRWLGGDDEPSEAVQLLERHCPILGEDLFRDCLECLRMRGSLMRRIRLARRVRRRLRVYARHSRAARMLSYLRLVSAKLWQRLSRIRKPKLLQGGGVVIAFVGPEATGKSTLTACCEQWLGEVFAVKRVHAGKPPPSFFTWPSRVLAPLLGRLPRKRRTVRSPGFSTLGASGSAPSPRLWDLVHAMRAVTLAWDRRRILIKARRAATEGEIVICDRYPSELPGAMDSRRLRELEHAKGLFPRLYDTLARMEASLYERIPPPDVVLQLNASIETAKGRNRTRAKVEDEAYLEARHRRRDSWQMRGTSRLYNVDTEGELTGTILEVKKIIWEAL